FFASRRRHTSFSRDWSSDVCSSDLALSIAEAAIVGVAAVGAVLVRRAPGIRNRAWPEIIAVAAVWVGVEQVRARWPFEGFPWGKIGRASSRGRGKTAVVA